MLYVYHSLPHQQVACFTAASLCLSEQGVDAAACSTSSGQQCFVPIFSLLGPAKATLFLSCGVTLSGAVADGL
jgi:hypothetical protein